MHCAPQHGAFAAYLCGPLRDTHTLPRTSDASCDVQVVTYTSRCGDMEARTISLSATAQLKPSSMHQPMSVRCGVAQWQTHSSARLGPRHVIIVHTRHAHDRMLKLRRSQYISLRSVTCPAAIQQPTCMVWPCFSLDFEVLRGQAGHDDTSVMNVQRLLNDEWTVLSCLRQQRSAAAGHTRNMTLAASAGSGTLKNDWA